MNTTLDLSANIIDVRDIIERVKELRDERDAQDITENEYGGPNDTWSDERTELAELENLLSDLQGMGGDEQFEGEWYPVTLIRDDYFTEYAQELAEDIGALNADAEWPNNCIDWDKAADMLQQDYSSVGVGELTYWTR